MVVRLMLAATALAAAGGAAAPTKQEISVARHDRILEETGVDGMAHCNRIKHVWCKASRRDPAEYRCAYREWAEKDPWPRKSVVLRRDGDDWRWVSGDSPKCSIIMME